MTLNNHFLKTKTCLLAALMLLVTVPIEASVIYTDELISKKEDHVIVVKNNSVIFDLLLPEEVIEDPVSIRVIEQPKFGELTLNEDESFKYAPLQNLCEKDDLVIYEIKAGGKVFEVSVFIEILCESLTIMSGMGSVEESDTTKLKTFKILGIENFPNNSLHIFDDVGNEVFAQESYKNDWTGVLEDNHRIETNRMYYYVFNDGGGNYYSGYLQIN